MSLQSIKADIVSVSDVHIREPDDLAARRLLALLDLIKKGEVGTFVLVGDIFEFILGSNRYFRKKFRVFGDKLTEVAQSGTRVIYLEGNHEFDLVRLGWEGVEVVTDRDLFVPVGLENQLTAKFTHGDLVYSPMAYRRFRRIVKSGLFLGLARWIPGPIMDWLCLRGADASRAQDQYRDMNYGRIFDEMSDWLGDDADFGVFGHFHVPFGNKIEGTHKILLSTDCWANPSALCLSSEGARRLHFDQDSDHPSRIESVTPFLGL